jgi:hypothetical protein
MANYQTDGKPSFHILISLIEIWKPTDVTKPMDKPDRSGIMMITECEQIEIVESYKQLIGTANVRFPRGTVIKRTITKENEYKYNSKVTADTVDHGIVIEKRADSKKADVTDFNIGDRITIRLGYTTDPKIADLAKVSLDGNKTIFNNDDLLKKYRDALTIMFEGYITQVSLDTPIELQCENLAGGLRRITCPKKTLKAATVNGLFSNDNKSDKLLEGTGLILDPKTQGCNISIGKLEMTSDLQVSDILLRLNERGLYGFVQIQNNQPVLTICRAYFSNPKNDSILKAASYSGNKQPVCIDFAYNVAENSLSLMDTDKHFMVVEATGTDKEGKILHVTVRLNPDWSEGDSEDMKWQFLNETAETKKSKKRKGSKKGKGGGGSGKTRRKRWKMSEYTIIKFISKEVSTTMPKLKEEAKKYFDGYNMNGIEGSLTLFGDLIKELHTASIVTLNDPRQPNKNGQYLVEELVTKFGVNGFRQTIKLPYCLARDNEKKKQTSNEQN